MKKKKNSRSLKQVLSHRGVISVDHSGPVEPRGHWVRTSTHPRGPDSTCSWEWHISEVLPRACVHAKSCRTLCDPMDGSHRPPGKILVPTRLLCPWDSLARILEWVAIPFCRSSQPRGGNRVAYVYLYPQAGSLTSTATCRAGTN